MANKGSISELFEGFSLPFDGFGVIRKNRKLWAHVLIPVTINILLFVAGFVALWSYRTDLIAWIYGPYPEQGFFAIALWVLVAVLVFALAIVGAYFMFTPIGCLIASPFNDVLAGRAEQILDPTVQEAEVPLNLRELMKTLAKEIVKVLAAGAVFVVVLLVNFIPVAGQVAAFLISAFLGGTVFALEYLDYPAARHGYSLSDLTRSIRANWWFCLGFGMGAMVLLIIPFVNLICIPACVVGATEAYVRLRRQGRLQAPSVKPIENNQ